MFWCKILSRAIVSKRGLSANILAAAKHVFRGFQRRTSFCAQRRNGLKTLLARIVANFLARTLHSLCFWQKISFQDVAQILFILIISFCNREPSSAENTKRGEQSVMHETHRKYLLLIFFFFSKFFTRNGNEPLARGEINKRNWSIYDCLKKLNPTYVAFVMLVAIMSRITFTQLNSNRRRIPMKHTEFVYKYLI